MKASELMARASLILQDEDYTRWTTAELAQWLTDSLREIALQMPTATARNIVVPLIEGTRQRLPDNCQQLLRVVRNIDMEGDNRVGKGVVTIVDRRLLDSQNPNWHDGQYSRFKPYARHFVFDETDPLTFYVWPGNDGTGNIEAVVSVIPRPVTADEGANADDVQSYSMQIDILDVYANILLDYTLYRAYCKDSQNAGAAQRAALYYQQFAQALGIKANSEMINSPNYKATGGNAS